MNDQPTVAGRRSLRAILSTVIAIVVIVSVFSTQAVAATSYEVTLVDGNSEYTITTDKNQPIDILNKAGVTLSTDDKLDISDFDAGQGGTIKIERLNTIYVEFNSVICSYDVYSSCVGDALNEIGIILNDSCDVNYSEDATIQSGMVITINSDLTVTLNVDGERFEYVLLAGNVSDLLTIAGVDLGDDDYTEPSLETALSNELEINVYRVTYEAVTKTKTIKYSTIETEDDTMIYGQSEVTKEGENGSKEVTYNVKYVNGVEESKEVISETVIEEAVDEEVIVGTKDKDVEPNGVTSKNGYTLGQVISGKYTRYCACSKCCGSSSGVTSSGKKVYNGMSDPHYVACNWLPLGSVIKVNGVNYTVVDRGGSSLSSRGRIDIFTPAGHSACLKDGKGSCTIEIIRLGW